MSSFVLLFCILAGEPQPLVYAAGYIPNIQFAPFYVAQARGYYTEEGIELKMDYTMGPDAIKLVALGKIHLGSADPDAFLHAVVRGLPLVNVATLYQRYPIALIAHENILNREGLLGKRIGISGTYGSSYLGLKAILAQLELSLAEVRISSIGFTQSTALQQKRVDVVVGYINNEPIRLGQHGFKTFTYSLPEGHDFPGVGLMTSKKFLSGNSTLVNGFLKATFRGMHDVVTDPKSCYKLVVDRYLPELKHGANQKGEYEILIATLPFWRSAYVEKHGYGQCDEARWHQLVAHLKKEPDSITYSNWPKWVSRDFKFWPETVP